MLKARYREVKLRVVIEGGKFDNYSSKLVWWSDIIALEKRLPGQKICKELLFLFR